MPQTLMLTASHSQLKQLHFMGRESEMNDIVQEGALVSMLTLTANDLEV